MRRARRIAWAAAAALLALALVGAGCGSKKAKSETLFAKGILPHNSGLVRMIDNQYRPPRVVVRPDEPLIWFNQGKAKHTATADPGQSIRFDTETVDPGKRKKIKMVRSGTFTYHCRFHPDMKGTLEIVR